MSTQRFIIGNTGAQNIDLSVANTITLNGSTRVNVSAIINSPAYQKGGLDADVVKLGNSYSPATSTTCGLQLPATLSATGYTTIYGINNMTNSTAGGGVSVIIGSRNLLSATFTGLGEIVVGDRNLQALNTGNNNCAFGTFNATTMTTGATNTFIGGFHAGTTTTGSNNICIGSGTTLPTTCDHSISMGTLVTGASNQFIFGTGTNFTRFASGCTTNTVDLGSTTQLFKTVYVGTSILGGSTQSIAFTGSDIVVNGGKVNFQNLPVSDKTPFGVLLSIPFTSTQVNAYTVANPTRLITMTSGPGTITSSLFTIGATGVMTYTGLVSVHCRVSINYTYTNATNTTSQPTHWISVNGSLTTPSNTTAVGNRLFVNALTGVFIPESVETILLLAPNDTIQLAGTIAPAANLTINYRNITYTVNYIMTNL